MCVSPGTGQHRSTSIFAQRLRSVIALVTSDSACFAGRTMLTCLRTPFVVTLLAAMTSVPCTATSSGPVPATLDATVKLSGGVLAVGVGYSWGHGTLSYQGQQIKFCIRGLSVGDVGIASLDAQGNVYNLKAVEDFAGKYFALSGGFAAARGQSATILKNKHGVMVELAILETGVRFNIAATGLKISLADQPGCKAG
jgi:hypothetical protein